MARSLNSVQLIGNLTRDPELRYTPTGTAVVTLGIATNRNWTTDTGEKKEEVEFHRIVAWNKLAEICSQLLTKGSKVYVHGRLTTRSWTAQDGTQKSVTEIIIDDIMVLSSKREGTGEETASFPAPVTATKPAPKAEVTEAPVKEEEHTQDVSLDDIPF